MNFYGGPDGTSSVGGGGSSGSGNGRCRSQPRDRKDKNNNGDGSSSKGTTTPTERAVTPARSLLEGLKKTRDRQKPEEKEEKKKDACDFTKHFR